MVRRVQYQNAAGMLFLILKTGSRRWKLCITRESVIQFLMYRSSLNFGRTRTTEDDKHPVLAVTTLSASIETSAGHRKIGLV